MSDFLSLHLNILLQNSFFSIYSKSLHYFSRSSAARNTFLSAKKVDSVPKSSLLSSKILLLYSSGKFLQNIENYFFLFLSSSRLFDLFCSYLVKISPLRNEMRVRVNYYLLMHFSTMEQTSFNSRVSIWYWSV